LIANQSIWCGSFQSVSDLQRRINTFADN